MARTDHNRRSLETGGVHVPVEWKIRAEKAEKALGECCASLAAVDKAIGVQSFIEAGAGYEKRSDLIEIMRTRVEKAEARLAKAMEFEVSDSIQISRWPDGKFTIYDPYTTMALTPEPERSEGGFTSLDAAWEAAEKIAKSKGLVS